MKELFKWTKGRAEDTEYWKFTLWYFKIWKWGFDAYILKYAPNTMLRPHFDEVDGRHWRLNISLWGRSYFSILKGRNSQSYGSYKTIQKRFIFFRPDIQKHTLLVSGKGCTKLSFGFVKFK